jgi:lipid-A-disaccharide synthase-like uncharacterized protein
VERELVKKSFLIEVAAVCSFIALSCLFYYYPLWHVVGFHYIIGQLSFNAYFVFALLALKNDLKKNVPHKGWKFVFRLLAALALLWATEGIGAVWPRD